MPKQTKSLYLHENTHFPFSTLASEKGQRLHSQIVTMHIVETLAFKLCTQGSSGVGKYFNTQPFSRLIIILYVCTYVHLNHVK